MIFKCKITFLSDIEKLNHFSLRHLRILVTVSEAGTITEAAERLGRSPGAISAAVQQFEEMVGVQLFVRKPAKGMALTFYGKSLVLEARGLLAHADDFRNIAGALGSPVSGSLSIACFSNLAPIILANLIAGFNRLYPGIHIQFLLGDQETVLQSLHSGNTELAISFDIGLTENIEATPVATLPARAVLPTSHRFASDADVSLRDLIDEPYMLMDLPYTREYFLSIFHALGLKPRIAFRSQSFETIRTLVGNGIGYSLLNLEPRSSQTYDGTSVIHVPLRERHKPLQMMLLTLSSVTRRSIVYTFKDYACNHLRNWSETVSGSRQDGTALRKYSSS